MRSWATGGKVGVLAAVLGALWVASAPAAAQTRATRSSAAEEVRAPASEGTGGGPRYSGSVNVDDFGPPPPGSSDDTVSAPLMVSLAYGFIWLLAAGFMWSIWRRSRSLQTELRAAQQRLEALDARLRSELGSSEGGEAGS